MNRDPVFIDHILHEIVFIEEKCSGKTLDDLISDEDLQHMVSRALEIIGEASRSISPDLKKEYSEIPWREIIGLRDRIIHGYFSINWVIVWDIITTELKDFKLQLSQIIE